VVTECVVWVVVTTGRPTIVADLLVASVSAMDARNATAPPIVTAVRPERPGDPAVPFIGLAEAYALAAFRHAGVPMQRIRPAIDVLAQELGLEHALASRRLYTDGAEVLYDYARHAGDTPEADSARELVVVRNNQRVFSEVVDLYLRRIDFAADGYAQLIRLPQYQIADVTVDPDHNFGRPRFAHGGAPVDDVVDLFRAGEPGIGQHGAAQLPGSLTTRGPGSRRRDLVKPPYVPYLDLDLLQLPAERS
jgi:hypothetical protein